jgi:hypothetical protein
VELRIEVHGVDGDGEEVCGKVNLLSRADKYF